MGTLSAEDRDNYRNNLISKLTDMLSTKEAANVEFTSLADESGVSFAIKIPKGSPELLPKVRELAGLISERVS